MSQPAPFSWNPLTTIDEGHGVGVGDGDEKSRILLLNQFPASYRIGDDLFASPDTPELNLIEAELNPKQLHNIIRFLWLAGRPVPPRPLHHQLLLGRDIAISENIDLHLVWGSGRMFLKPIPSFLLNPVFWKEYLTCRCTPASPSDSTPICFHSEDCQRRHHLHECAYGFLLSYVALIPRESDFWIAREKRLIPFEISWAGWRYFVRELLRGQDGNLSAQQLYAGVAKRFIYGELRLHRLKLIDKVLHGPFSKRFLSTWDSYTGFVNDNSAAIITGTAYILLLLSAMQVGLGTNQLADNAAFQAVSYGFTVFSIVGPLGFIAILWNLFMVAFWYNLVRTRNSEASRAKALGRTWRKPEQTVGFEVRPPSSTEDGNAKEPGMGV
ncbi:Fc.00g004140.m01.CDS01 [Cosmosporella sp. VM-42]